MNVEPESPSWLFRPGIRDCSQKESYQDQGQVNRQEPGSKGGSNRNTASELKDKPDALPCVIQIFVTPKPTPCLFLNHLEATYPQEIKSDLFPPVTFASCSSHQKIQL